MKYRNLAIVITGILLGFLIILQSRSFRGVQEIIGRDTRANVFREIQILKTTNENLEDEINDLEGQLDKASDREQALKAIQDEIKKDKILAGQVTSAGPGIEVSIKGTVPIIWLTDIANELWSGGAEALSVNNIRITNSTVGFDILPNGEISLNGALLSAPYTFQAIGDQKVLFDAINQTQGILDRLHESLPSVEVTIEQKPKLIMEKTL